MNTNGAVPSTALRFFAISLLITQFDAGSIVAAQDREQARPPDGGIDAFGVAVLVLPALSL